MKGMLSCGKVRG
jgi:hypothetical protein